MNHCPLDFSFPGDNYYYQERIILHACPNAAHMLSEAQMKQVHKASIMALAITLSCLAGTDYAVPQGAFTLSSGAFSGNGPIPKKYTCQGSNTPLPLSWQGAPSGTRSFALVMDDPDARPVVGYVWVHWVVYNIPADVRAIPEKLSRAASVKLPGGQAVTQGLTSWNRPGYGGPCPPAGTGTHHYNFTLYALASGPDLPAGLTRDTLVAGMKGKILAEAKLTGTFRKD
jgi:hypothetical protein